MAEPLWYTVQTNSYVSQEDAERHYAVLASELSTSDRTDLRIEYISSYYTVRIGKFNSQHDILPLFETIKKWSDAPAIIHAFIRNSRIIRSFSGNGIKNATSAISITPVTPNIAGQSSSNTPRSTSGKKQQISQRSKDFTTNQKTSSNKVGKKSEPLFYTVQIGTFITEKDTVKLYELLARKLPLAMREFLRVEKISSFFTVRAGKTKRRQAILPLLEQTRKFVANPAIIHGYLRRTRIIKSYTSFHSAVIKSPPTADEKSLNILTTPIATIPVQSSDDPKDSVKEPKKQPSFAITVSPKSSQKKSSEKEPLFFTVQMGSYVGINDANRFHDLLAKKLPADKQDFLRVEKISSYYTVRLGKTKNRSDILMLLEAAKKSSDNPAIIHAYFRDSRIVKSIQTSSLPVEKKIALKPLTVTPDVTRHPSTASPLPLPIPLAKPIITDADSTIKQISTEENPKQVLILPLKPPEPLLPQKSPVEKNVPPILQPSKPQPALSSQEYEKLVLSKYLANDHKAKDIAKSRKLADSFPITANCTTVDCHVSINKIQNGHYPAKKSKCTSCHIQTNKQHPNEAEPAFHLQSEGAALCRQCHLTVIQGKNVHSPVSEGECLQCHSPHGSGNLYLLTVPKGAEQQLCSNCHDDSLGDFKYQHGPVESGACTHCHNPHASNYEALLRDDPEQLCFTCHFDFIKKLNESSFIHSPVKDHGCQGCHAAHGSNYPNLLSVTPDEFCFSCHPEVEEKLTKSRSKHAGLYLEKQCGTCHLAHFSKYGSLLVEQELSLCLSCHRANAGVGSFSPKDIKTEIESNEYIHTPITEGKCTGCHDQHASKYDKLLKDSYPSAFYAPYKPDTYKLCFNCHEPELLSDPKTDSTNFRNGTLNLHYTHVALERKGRTCQACHRPHASDGPKLINRTGAKFGAWTMSIDFTLTTSGGSCMPGCHRELAYDRETPTDYSSEDDSYEKPFIDYQAN